MVRVCIVGAGLSGLAAARAISLLGHRIVLHERLPSLAFSARESARLFGATIVQSAAATAALEDLQVGLVEPLGARRMQFFDHEGERQLFSVDGANRLCGTTLRERLVGTLLASSDVAIRFGSTIQSEHIKLDHNESGMIEVLDEQFDVLLGCDGVQSIVRPLLPDLIQPTRSYPLTRITFDSDKFAEHDTDSAFVGLNSIAMVTKSESKSWRVSMVIPVDDDDKATINSSDYIAAIRQGQWMSKLLPAFYATISPSISPICDRDTPSGCLSKNIALLGDALRPLVPYSAHGASLALADGVALAASIQESGSVSTFWEQVQSTSHVFIEEARSMMGFLHAGEAADQLLALSSQKQMQSANASETLSPAT